VFGNESPHTDDNDGQMASSRSTPVSRQSPAASRAFEGETCEIGASSSATKDEIPRSESSNDKASENGAFPFFGQPWESGSVSGASRIGSEALVLPPCANHV
jgi:hypothetical protein